MGQQQENLSPFYFAFVRPVEAPDILSRLVHAGRDFSYDMAVSFITDAENCIQGH